MLGVQCEVIGDPQKRLIREGRPLGLKFLDGARDLGLALEWARALREHDLSLVERGLCVFVGRTVFDPGPLSQMADRMRLTLEHWMPFIQPLRELGIVVGIEVPYNEEWSTDLAASLQLLEASIEPAKQIAALGAVPIVYVTGEGNPKGTDADPFADWRDPRMQALLRALRGIGAWWGAHEYEVDGKKDSIDGWHVGRAEQVYANVLPPDCWLPIAFGELGYDGRTDPPQSWRAHWSGEEYAQHWLRPQRGMMLRFRSCRAGFIFLSGTSGRWSSFDVADEAAVIALLRERPAISERWTVESSVPSPAPPPKPRPQPKPQEKPMPIFTPESNPWWGKLLTVWNLPADPADLIASVRALACDGVEIKVSDGDSRWGSNRHVTRAYVERLREAGLRVLGWSYNYCDGLVNAGDRGNGVPEGEARAALAAIAELGLEGWTADLEIECEGHPDFVARLLDDVRNGTGVPIAAHTWAYLSGHERYPADEIASRVDVLRPMIYRPTWNAARTWSEWGRLYQDRIVCPVWGLTEGTAVALKTDTEFADGKGIPGEAYWELSAVRGLAPAVRDLIAGRRFGAEVPSVRLDLPAAEAALHRLWPHTVRLADVLEHRELAEEMQREIAALKVALKLQEVA